METEANQPGNPDVGTARQESLEADMDQYFKDLLEASSLGTPAARRICDSAPAGAVDDVRRRIMTREGQRTRPQSEVPGDPRIPDARPARFLRRAASVQRLRPLVPSTDLRPLLEDVPRITLVPARTRLRQDFPDDASYDLVHPAPRAADEGNGKAQADARAVGADGHAATGVLPEDLDADAGREPGTGPRLTVLWSPGLSLDPARTPAAPVAFDPAAGSGRLLKVLAHLHGCPTSPMRITDRWAPDLDFILRDHVFPGNEGTRDIWLTHSSFHRDPHLRDQVILENEGARDPWLAHVAFYGDFRDWLVARTDAGRQPSRPRADAVSHFTRLWDAADVGRITTWLCETAGAGRLPAAARLALRDVAERPDDLQRDVTAVGASGEGKVPVIMATGAGKSAFLAALLFALFDPASQLPDDKRPARGRDDAYLVPPAVLRVIVENALRQKDGPPVIPGENVTRWDSDWIARAACKGIDPDELFVQGAAQNRAKLVCRGCPVRTECLADALDSGIEFGVWGGMTERERRALLRRRPDVTSWCEILMAAQDKYERQETTDPDAGLPLPLTAERRAALAVGTSPGAAVSWSAQDAGGWRVSPPQDAGGWRVSSGTRSTAARRDAVARGT